MSGFRIDEAPAPETFVAGHRANFGGSMDGAEYAWWFNRTVGGPTADVWVYFDEDVAAAGSAVSYRMLATGELVAVMTGSWTDPAYRRRGLFRETIERSRELAALRGAQALLGFAAAVRTSIAPLSAVAARVADAWVLEPSDHDEPPPADPVPPVDELQEWFDRNRLGAHFAYDGDVFRQQLRLPQTDVRRLGESSWGMCNDGMLLAAISERAWDAAEAATAIERSGLTAYTTVPGIAARRKAAAAVFFVIPVGPAVPAALLGPLDFQAADRA
jgi:hypothetical protein